MRRPVFVNLTQIQMPAGKPHLFPREPCKTVGLQLLRDF